MKVSYVDIGAQYLEQRDEILSNIDNFLKSGDYILGEALKNFEEDFAKLCQVKHAIGVADGTAALSLALRVLGIGEGDEVITAPNSFFSSASSIVHVGAIPIFADVKPDQMINPAAIEAKITSKTKAIIPVHLTGKMADMNYILEIAQKYKLYVIEDAAQAVGASYREKKAGSMGIIGCFSLHPLKNLNAAGDAGIMITNDDELAKKLRLIRNHGMIDRDTIPEFGYNCRLDTIQAVILNSKLKKLEDVILRRRRNADLYRKQLEGIVELPNDDYGSFDVYHLFVIQCDRRDELKKNLADANIGTSIHYPTPIHLLQCFEGNGYKNGDYPETERQAKRILSLPIHQNLTEEQIKYVCAKIKKFYQ